MKYYFFERRNGDRTAFVKAPADVGRVAEEQGYKKLEINSCCPKGNSLRNKICSRVRWMFESWRLMRVLKKGDTVLMQSPPAFFCRAAGRDFLMRLRARGVCFAYLIHDIGELRESEEFRGVSRILFMATVRPCDYIIAHNFRMRDWLVQQGISKSKIRVLGIFDYLLPESSCLPSVRSDGHGDMWEIVLAGNLSAVKSPYIGQLSRVTGVNWRLYGPNYFPSKGHAELNIQYCGSVEPDDLPKVLRGDFGLVWDGLSIETCAGPTGEYLRYNNPHKLSLYLACGMPVIIWSQAAEASLVQEECVGVVVNSLLEIPRVLETITERQYEVFCSNARNIATRLRTGYYTRLALKDIELG